MVLPMWAFWVVLGVMGIGLIGVILPAVPGVGLIWIAALVYAIAEGFTTIDPLTFAALTVLGAIGVTADIWVSQAGGKLGGASWQALLTGLGLGAVGFILGLVAGGIGALPAGMVGMLLGILLVEYLRRGDWKETVRVGAGWAAGCLLSGVVQLFVSLTMILIFVWQALRG
ncbi:MAG TPA: DUF456 domain-containing protein [Anaerolineae bacterium]|nr:DUF456 domain-containing protein [Anaerolineae bacterium]